MDNADIVIVGGGIVGLTLASALAETSLRTIVIEKSDPPPVRWNKTSFDLRVSAINHASQTIFQSLGIWDAIVKMRVSPFRLMQVWDASGNGKIHFDCTAIGQPYLGHIIENRVIQRALLQHLHTRKNVQLLYSAQPMALLQGKNQVAVELADQVLEANLLVGADGSQSWVREQAQLSVKTSPYHQSALVTTVKTEKPHQQTAWQRFLPTGPLAFLPLSDPHTCSIVWSSSSAYAEDLMQMRDTTFDAAITEAFSSALGKVEALDQRVIFPLHMLHAKHYVKPHIALIGDAAHTIHPLAGQGVNLGLLDATCLAEVIHSAYSQKRDIGSITTLRRYERWRKGDNLLMVAAMEAFKQLFGSQLRPVVKTRNWGLQLTDRLAFIKNIFAQRAMGLTGDLPALAKVIYPSSGVRIA